MIDGQIDAYRACLSPGVRLVWGPPGAGKTRVLARAIEDLIGAGKRVLMLSTANIAVDNALHTVVQAMQPRRGTAIGVGPPQLAEVANNPHVNLGQLAAAASTEIDQKLRKIEQQLSELYDIDTEAARLSEEVFGFDPPNYWAALRRIENEENLNALTQQIRDTEVRGEESERCTAAKRVTLQCLQNDWNHIASARKVLHEAEKLTAELHRLAVVLKSKQTAVTSTELGLIEASGWLTNRKARTVRDKAVEALRAFEPLYGERQSQLSEWIVEHQERARPITQDYVTNLDTEIRNARLAADEAERTEATVQSQLQELRVGYQTVRNRGLPTEADHEFVRRARSANLPATYKQLEHLKGQQRDAATQRGKLEESHRHLVDRSRKLRKDVEKQLIGEASLVATTLARSRLHPALAAAHFDIVLVDEAGAAGLAEVLLALCRATETAVLFGDFLQLPPVQNKKIKDSTHEHFRKWKPINRVVVVLRVL